MTIRTRTIGVFAALLIIYPSAGAWAEKPLNPGSSTEARESIAGKTRANDKKTEVTEDNDTNDGGTPNNVVDEGDNRHPSGKDRSVEAGGAGNQGNASSDPDDGHDGSRSNGGTDQPDGPGGDDLADQDGNNGCGNDDDFEDDNRGWCGRPPAERESGGSVPPGGGGDGTGSDLIGGDVTTPTASETLTPLEEAVGTGAVAPSVLGLVVTASGSGSSGANVLGLVVSRGGTFGALAFTGTDVRVLLGGGLLLLALGAWLILAGRRREAHGRLES